MVLTPLFLRSPTGLAGALVFASLLCFAAVCDVRTRRIPNRAVGALAAAGIVYSLATAGVVHGLVQSFGGLGVGLLLWLPFYAIGWMGAGDVKLFAAAGAWLGPERAFIGSLAGALAGGVLAGLWMLRAYGIQGTAVQVSLGLRTPSAEGSGRAGEHSRRSLPYGVSLATGALAAAWIPEMIAGGVRVAR